MGKKAASQAILEQQAEVNQKLIHQGRFIQIRQDVIQIPGRSAQVWDLVIHPGAVAIIPIDKKGHLILVEQWRRAIGKVTIEIPAGTRDDQEAPEVCAQRELREEIGYKANTLIPLGGCFPAPGLSNEYVHLFIGKDLEKSPLKADDTEVIDILELSFEKALEMIEKGVICDAKTVVGVLRYLRT